jgi:hypothetical protein
LPRLRIELLSISRGVRITALAALLCVLACGDDAASPDAGLQNFELQVLDPPGDAIGLALGGDITLRVRYLDDSGASIDSAEVGFSILTTGSEDDGGSTLASDSVQTDSNGIAEVALLAGAERVNFRVLATADNAAPATFYVAVSETGFTDIQVTPLHQGGRLESDFASINLRLFTPNQLTCNELDIDALPESIFVPRTVNKFGDRASFPNILSESDYVLVGWAATLNGPEYRQSVGCTALDSAQTTNPVLSLSLAIADRAVLIPSPLGLTTEVDMAPVHDALEAAGAHNGWSTLECPVGPGQLVLDCTIDAMDSDGTLDCIYDAGNSAAQAVAASRGTIDAFGCRPQDNGGPTLDANIASILTVADLAPIIGRRTALLSLFSVESHVTPSSLVAAAHQLRTATVEDFSVSLLESARPTLEQGPLDLQRSSLDTASSSLTLPTHGFTLRYADFAKAAMADVSEPLNLELDTLAESIVTSAMDAGDSGCVAISALICAETGGPANCAEAACTAATSAMGSELDRWLSALDTVGLDFTVGGSLLLTDTDDDLLMDGIEADPDDAWEAGLLVVDSFVSLPATPSATPAP